MQILLYLSVFVLFFAIYYELKVLCNKDFLLYIHRIADRRSTGNTCRIDIENLLAFCLFHLLYASVNIFLLFILDNKIPAIFLIILSFLSNLTKRKYRLSNIFDSSISLILCIILIYQILCI